MAYYLSQQGNYVSLAQSALQPHPIDELSDFSEQPAPLLEPVPLQSIVEAPLADPAPSVEAAGLAKVLDSPFAWIAAGIVGGKYLGLLGGAAAIGAALLLTGRLKTTE